MTTAELLAEREKTHGKVTEMAEIYCGLVFVIEAAPGADHLSPVQRMALHMNAIKTARILAGNPNFPDHWRDLAGYPALALQELEGRNNV